MTRECNSEANKNVEMLKFPTFYTHHGFFCNGLLTMSPISIPARENDAIRVPRHKK